LSEKDLAEFVALQHKNEESENSWIINVADLDPATLDLSAKNPNRKEETDLRTPAEIAAEMQGLNEENTLLLNDILSILQ